MRNLKREAARRGAGSERSARHATEEPRATAATTTATTEKPTAGTTEKPMVMGARTSCTVDSHSEFNLRAQRPILLDDHTVWIWHLQS